jgi:hypothetical protein
MASKELALVIVCVLGIVVALVGVVTHLLVLNVTLDSNLPTPSCPQGAIPPSVPIGWSELGAACADERANLYLPVGFHYLPRYLFFSVIVSSIALACVWIGFRHELSVALMLRGQAALFVALVLWGSVVTLFAPDIPGLIPGPVPLTFP